MQIRNLKIIDTHIHFGKYTGSFINFEYEDLLIEITKTMGFEKIIFIHNSFFFDLDKGLKNTLKLISENKDFLYGYLVYNPHYIENSINMIKEHFGKNGIVGIKMHPEDHLCFITDEKYEPLWKIASERRIPILSHTWNPNVPSKIQKYADALLFEKVINKYPKLKIIMAHAGAKDYYYYDVIEMLKRCGNKEIYVDIAGDIFYRGMIEYFVKEIGSEKVLFGSDAPWIDPVFTLTNVLKANITIRDRENILYNNAARVFGI
jgi:predicted TIM-barrel fold metal-dependent hydrolase